MKEIEINYEFLSAFRNEHDFNDWLWEKSETHEIHENIDDIIRLLTNMQLEKFVMKAVKFKNLYV